MFDETGLFYCRRAIRVVCNEAVVGGVWVGL